MAESKIQKQIIDYLESKGYYVVKVILANKRGVPDILFCKDGMFNAIEVKDTGKSKNVTELQKHHINLIQRSGGFAMVADSLELVKQYF